MHLKSPRKALLPAITGLVFTAMLPSCLYGGWFSEVRVTYSKNAQLAHPNARPMAPGPDGRVHLVWRDGRDGNDEIYYKCLYGTGWTGDRRLTYDTEGSAGACVAVDAAKKLHIAWHDFRHGEGEINWEIFYKSGDGTSWGPDERLTRDLGISTNPSLALDEAGNAYVVWQDSRNAESEIYFKMYDGSTWGEDARLSYGGGRSDYPMLAVSPGGGVHVVWTDRRDRNKEIYYKHYDGSAWSEEVRLTVDGWISEDASICLDGAGNPHVVWADNRDGNHEIYYKHFDGLEWGPDVRLTFAENASTMPCITPDDSSNLHVIWIDRRDAGEGIYYKARRGSEWSEDKRLTERAEGVTKPSICMDAAGNLHVVWQDDRHGGQTIYWKERYNGTLGRPALFTLTPATGNRGETVPVRVTGQEFVYPCVELVRADSSGLLAVDVVNESDSAFKCRFMLDNTEIGLYDVVVRNADGQSDTLAGGFEVLAGLVWAEDCRLTFDAAASQTSESRSIEIDPAGGIHVVWHDMRDGKREIYYKCREAGRWGMDERVTESGGGMRCPCVAADKTGRIHVVWQATEAGGYEVYYRCRDGGRWNESRRLNRDPGFSLYPDIAADDSDRVHVVWCDNSSGDFQIVYRVWDGTSWSRKTQLTASPGASTHPSIAAGEEGTLHLVWQNDRDGYNQIYYSMFDGSAWGAEERVSESTSEAVEPGVAVDPDGDVHVVWNDFRSTRSVYSRVYYRSKGPEGWTGERAIPGTYYQAGRPSIAVDHLGIVHVVWQCDWYDTQGIAWARGSLDSWRHEVILPRTTALAMLPSLAASEDGQVHMVYCNDAAGNSEIYCSSLSRDPAEPPVIYSVEPHEAYNSDSLHTWIWGTGLLTGPSIWLENSSGDTLVAEDIDWKSQRLVECEFQMVGVCPGQWDLHVENRDGQSDRLDRAITVLQGPWSLPEEISGGTASVSTGYNNARSLAREPNGTCHAVWRDKRDSNYEIYYRQGIGDVWGTEIRLTECEGKSGSPSMVLGPQHAMHLCWNDYRSGSAEIYYRKFHGTFWGPEQRISPDDSVDSVNPSMALDGAGNPFLFYEDRRYGPWQVMCSRWDGSRWIEERIIDQKEGAYHAACLTDGLGCVHVFWESKTGGSREIFHRVWTGSIWEEASSIATGWFYSPTCACDCLGRVMVVWSESWYSKLRGVIRYDGEWHDMAGIPGYGWSSNLAADGIGRFHLVSSHNGKINYQSYGDTWSVPTRINRGSYGNTPFVAADASGRPVVIWTAGKDDETRIVARRWEGDPAVSGIDGIAGSPVEFGIARVKPNPFRAATEIRFGLASASDASVDVFDVTGRLIWKASLADLDPGYHSAMWGGEDAHGRKVSPGVYFVRLGAGGRTAHAKVVLLR